MKRSYRKNNTNLEYASPQITSHNIFNTFSLHFIQVADKLIIRGVQTLTNILLLKYNERAFILVKAFIL